MFVLRGVGQRMIRQYGRHGRRQESTTTKRSLPTLDQFLWNEQTIETARCPPTSWYTNPDFLHVELQQTFRNNWLFYGRKEQFKSNSFVAKTIAGEPIVVVRNEVDKLVGYYNVCRHHAAQLLDEGEGTCSAERRITCPYHGWYSYLIPPHVTSSSFSFPHSCEPQPSLTLEPLLSTPSTNT